MNLIGVIIGFIVGNMMLTYVYNGQVIELICFNTGICFFTMKTNLENAFVIYRDIEPETTETDTTIPDITEADTTEFTEAE